jgi:hypothetical protein
MLAAIDLHDKSLSMAGEVHDVPIDLNLSTKVGSVDSNAMAQVPPQSSLCDRWRTSHGARKRALWEDVRPIMFHRF